MSVTPENSLFPNPVLPKTPVFHFHYRAFRRYISAVSLVSLCTVVHFSHDAVDSKSLNLFFNLILTGATLHSVSKDLTFYHHLTSGDGLKKLEQFFCGPL